MKPRTAIVQRRYTDHDRIDGLFDQMVAGRNKVALNAGHENFMEYAFVHAPLRLHACRLPAVPSGGV